MKQKLLIGIALLAVGCQPANDDLLPEQNPVLIGCLMAGQTAQGIRFFQTDPHSLQPALLSQSTLWLTGPNGSREALQNDGHQFFSTQTTLQHQATYQLLTEYGGETISVQCQTPPPLVLVHLSQNPIAVDPQSQGQPVSAITWNQLDTERYSYVLKLECLETNPQPIPFEVVSGNFDRLYRNPILTTTLTLFDTDFKYYGHHRLTVIGIDRSWEKLYFYQPSDIRGLLQSAPGNVTGAQGFVAAATQLVVDLWVE